MRPCTFKLPLRIHRRLASTRCVAGAGPGRRVTDNAASFHEEIREKSREDVGQEIQEEGRPGIREEVAQESRGAIGAAIPNEGRRSRVRLWHRAGHLRRDWRTRRTR